MRTPLTPRFGAVEEMPKNGPSHRVVIVALVRLGRLEEAREATARLLEIASGKSPRKHQATVADTRLCGRVSLRPAGRRISRMTMRHQAAIFCRLGYVGAQRA